MSLVASQPRYGVVGCGRLGGALVDALRRGGLDLSAVVKGASGALATNIPADLVCSMHDLPSRADRVFLTVPDESLAEVARLLPLTAGQALVHCSGANDLSVLAPAADRGALVGVFHPLQAFPAGSDANRFFGIAVGIDAHEPLFTELSHLAEALGATPLSLRGVNRARYHAAAVFSSNYAVALMEAASIAFVDAGLPASVATASLLPLMKGAVEAMADRPLAEALTGPVARGDVKTVAQHMDALSSDPLLRQVYAVLGQVLLRLDRPKSEELRQQLRVLFEAQEFAADKSR